MRISDILKNKSEVLYTTAPDTPLSQCVVTMAFHNAGSLLVMENSRLVGLLSFREVITILAKYQEQSPDEPPMVWESLLAKDVMKTEPIVITPQMDFVALRELMVNVRQRYMPVVEDGVVHGVVSFYDVAKAIHEKQELENRSLKAYIHDYYEPIGHDG